MDKIKAYLRRKQLSNRANRWLRANNPHPIAAMCLFHLNRHVRRKRVNYPLKQEIYYLKRFVIQTLYQSGYCVSATKHIQTLPCWHSWEYNNGFEGYCYKCDNTGIYAEHELYRFTFNVYGRYYIWHQPASMVEWSVELSNDEVEKYDNNSGGPAYHISRDRVDLYLATLWQYLRLHSDCQLLEPGLKTAIRAQWRVSVWRPLQSKWHYEYRPKLDNLRRLFEFVRTGRMPQGVDEDEIPF